MSMVNSHVNFGLLILLTAISFSCSQKIDTTDKAQKIISLAPNITETLFALGVEDRILAVSDYCYYPAQAMKKETVGGLFNPNLEKITALQPDLILATESNHQLVEKFKGKNIRVILLPEKTINDVFRSIDTLAIITGRKKQAEWLIQGLRDSLSRYDGSSRSHKPTAILVLGRDKGSTRNIGISGPGAFINELWEHVGGKNAFADMPGAYTQVNREDLLVRDPQIIVEIKSPDWDDKLLEANKTEWRDLPISAVKSGNIYTISGVNMLVPGPRIYLLARQFSLILKKYEESLAD